MIPVVCKLQQRQLLQAAVELHGYPMSRQATTTKSPPPTVQSG
jgi:hypothetical protein